MYGRMNAEFAIRVYIHNQLCKKNLLHNFLVRTMLIFPTIQEILVQTGEAP